VNLPSQKSAKTAVPVPSPAVVGDPVSAIPPDVSVIIPIFNEADNIGTCLMRCDEVFANSTWSVEFILVDDGSTDSSVKAAAETPLKHCSSRILELPHHSGKTVAIRTGVSASTGRYIALMDADLQYDARDLPTLLSVLGQGWGGVNGWRAQRKDGLGRKLPSKVYNWLIKVTFGIQIHDANSGLKVFQAEALRSIALEGDAHRLLLPLIHSAGYSVAEVPVRHYARTRGRSKYGILRLVTGSVSVLGLKVISVFGWNPKGVSVRGWNFFHHRVWASIERAQRPPIAPVPLIPLGARPTADRQQASR
jgi:glycosyltransferase involved in cell wall biosynthesis